LSRIGRWVLGVQSRKRVKTPTMAHPLNNLLFERHIKEIQELGRNSFLIISNRSIFNSKFWKENNEDFFFIFDYTGKIETFRKIINENGEKLINADVLTIIPFNNPTSSIDKVFALNEINHQLGIARRILADNPNIKFGLTIKLFDHPELLDEYESIIKDHDNIVLLNFTDIFNEFGHYRSFLEVIFCLKSTYNNNIALMASGHILPKHYPFLIYIGVDIINSSYSTFKGANNLYDGIDYLMPFDKIQYLPCSCEACRKLIYLIEQKRTIENTILIQLHNTITAHCHMNKINQYLISEDFRAFVEKSCLNDLNLLSALKILDKQYVEYLKNETPITQNIKVVTVLGPSSYNRPDFLGFRNRLLKHFKPESDTRIIILLPCSAKKPYSESKSHQKFLKILKKFSNFNSFQEIILTSPLGAIPRELEQLYPASSYDISVTGYWDEEELQIASKMLAGLIEKHEQNIPVICHLEGQYLEIVSRAQKLVQNPFFFTNPKDGITSRESLLSLKNTVQKCSESFIKDHLSSSLSKLKNYWTRSIIKILDYQFRFNVGEIICINGIKTRNNRTNTQLEFFDASSREKLGIFKKKSGQVLLSIKGAERIKPPIPNFIVFDGDKISGNTLFRPGILDFSNDILPESNVIVLDKEGKKVIGVGISLVGANFLKNSKIGRVVRIYEKIK
ncbi:MAG: DUF5591 domain-containing protein, partial [Promethearchaeota archaeon]